MTETRTHVVLLGTGTPRTEVGRAGTSTAVVVDDRPYVFDFGPGVGLRLSEGHEMGIAGLVMSDVTRAFLTHMHSDHTMGLGELMLTPWMFGREEPLEVYGPHGTAAMTRAIAAAYSLDVAKRTLNEPHTRRGHEITGRDVTRGVVYTDDLVEIEAFEVQHGEWKTSLHGPFPAMGYRITTPDRIVVISGDTGLPSSARWRLPTRGPLCTGAISTSSDTNRLHPPAIRRSARAHSACSPTPRQGRRRD